MPNYLEKEWTALPPARVRGANLYSLRVCTRWRSLKPCAQPGERSILREAPQGRSDKMWSESTFATNSPAGARPSPPVYWLVSTAGYWEKYAGGPAIFFPSSTGLCYNNLIWRWRESVA